MSFEVILQFLRPIAHLIQDPDVTEIMVNGSRRIFVERQGLLEEVDGVQLPGRSIKCVDAGFGEPKFLFRRFGIDQKRAETIGRIAAAKASE